MTDTSPIKLFNFHEYSITPDGTDESPPSPYLLTHFPNPYVPANSSLFKTTRIVRVPRTYDNSSFDLQNSCPQYSEYFPGTEPGALIPSMKEDGTSQGLSSKSPLENYLTHFEYDTIVKEINGRLRKAYYPWNWRNIVGNILGFFTLWLSDYLITPQIDLDLLELERYIDRINENLHEVKIISLRRSGYLSLDFQIPAVS